MTASHSRRYAYRGNAVSRGLGSECGRRHAQVDSQGIEATRRRTSIGHGVRYPKITSTVPGGAMAARLTVQKWWQPLGETQE